MSVDFAGVKKISIPEGDVVKITKKADGSLIWEKPITVKMITFYVDYTAYTAEEGMTWGEFVESEYNTDGFYAKEWLFGTAIYTGGPYSSRYIRENSGGSDGTVVDSTDEIKANTTYYTNKTNSPLP